MTTTGKNVYYDGLVDIINKYNNTKHNTIKMEPIDVIKIKEYILMNIMKKIVDLK